MKFRNGKFEKNNDGSNLLELDVGKGVLNSGICVYIYIHMRFKFLPVQLYSMLHCSIAFHWNCTMINQPLDYIALLYTPCLENIRMIGNQ